MPITEAETNRIKEFENRGIVPDYPYWYGIKKGLYAYLGLPQWLPVNVHLDHGAMGLYRKDKPDYETSHNDYPIIFVNNKYQKDICTKYNIKKAVYVLGATYPHYRKKMNIKRSSYAKGTIAYPWHSTHLITAQFDYLQYAKALKSLPVRFQPVTVSLYWKEVLNGMHRIFENEGLDVVTNGHMFDEEFINNFYRNISGNKYATSNEIGSWLFCAIELGVCAFIYGDEVSSRNEKGDSNVPLKQFQITKKFGYIKHEEIRNAFTPASLAEVDGITEEQQRIVADNNGTNDCLSKGKARLIVLYSLLLAIKKLKSRSRNIVIMTASKVLPKFIKNAIYYLISKDFREERRKDRILWELVLMPRYREGTTDVFGKHFKFVDSTSFHSCYTSIFKNEIFKFCADTETPYIIDCGANIGLSVLYFKKLYPTAKITAFEPDKKIFIVLKENIEAFHLTDIELVNKGVWKEDSFQRFFSEGSDAGRIAHSADQGNIVEVPMFSLRKYLDRPVDFLKIDIEGAETEVLEDCEDLLKNVKRLYVEYHSFACKEQTLDELLSILRRAGFRVSIGSLMHSAESPFLNVNEYMGMDLQLDIFGYRS